AGKISAIGIRTNTFFTQPCLFIYLQFPSFSGIIFPIMKTTLSSVILILIAAVATAMAQIVLKIGSRLNLTLLKSEIVAKGTGSITNIFNTSSEIFHLFIIGTGFFLFMITMLMLAKGFKGGDMSLLYPIFSTSFIWNIIFSRVILGEGINIFKILGVFIIVSGIALTGFGQEKK
ncbi:MAG TPA: hypothetical protein PL110_13825, partial [Candidatus Eremiobacteraeota bacterium]|nr:hypothetical protein [Candidatus Eremiobacteraeota bacterium]